MTTPNVFIARHGLSRRNPQGLTEEGRQGVLESADNFATSLGETGDSTIIFSAPELRATETAGIFAEKLGVEPATVATWGLLRYSDVPPTKEELLNEIKQKIAKTTIKNVLLVGYIEEITALTGRDYNEVLHGRVFPVELESPVFRSLPPNLRLPTAKEPTDIYRKENFKPRSLEDMVPYARFMIALMVWQAGTTDTARVSFMPIGRDFDEMYAAGYGPSDYEIKLAGGVKAIQLATDFYPNGYRPEEAELRERLKWMRENSRRPYIDFDPATTEMKDILTWGWNRDLLPSEDITYEVLGNNTDEERELFSVERPHYRKQNTFFDLYRLGAKVLRDHQGKPPSREKLDEQYGDEFLGKPSEAIRMFFGSQYRFWLEFDQVTDSKGEMTDQEAVDQGIRQAIALGEPNLEYGTMKSLGRDRKLSFSRVEGMGVPLYRKRVAEGYEAYLQLHTRLVAQGVGSDVVQIACQKFEHSSEFEAWLERHVSALQILSNGSDEASRLLERIQNGLDLENEERYVSELTTAHEDIEALRLTSWQRRFILDLIPRLNTREALDSQPVRKEPETQGVLEEEKGDRFDLTNWGVQIVMRGEERIVKVGRKFVFKAPSWATDVIERVFDKGGCLSDELLDVARDKNPQLTRGDLHRMLDTFRKFLYEHEPKAPLNWKDRMVKTFAGPRRLVQAKRVTGVGEFTEPEEAYWG